MKNTCKQFRGLNRRDFLRIGGLSLCGLNVLDVLRAQASAGPRPKAKAKQMICVWMAGGPPHIDMFQRQ